MDSLTRIAAVDDQLVFLEQVKKMFENNPTFEIITTEVDSEKALDSFTRLQPDVVIVDVMMPKMNGFVFTKKLLKQLPTIKVVVVSDSTEKAYPQLAVNVGAIAFIPKKQLSLESFIEVLTKDDP